MQKVDEADLKVDAAIPSWAGQFLSSTLARAPVEHAVPLAARKGNCMKQLAQTTSSGKTGPATCMGLIEELVNWTELRLATECCIQVAYMMTHIHDKLAMRMLTSTSPVTAGAMGLATEQWSLSLHEMASGLSNLPHAGACHKRAQPAEEEC